MLAISRACSPPHFVVKQHDCMARPRLFSRVRFQTFAFGLHPQPSGYRDQPVSFFQGCPFALFRSYMHEEPRDHMMHECLQKRYHCLLVDYSKHSIKLRTDLSSRCKVSHHRACCFSFADNGSRRVKCDDRVRPNCLHTESLGPLHVDTVARALAKVDRAASSYDPRRSRTSTAKCRRGINRQTVLS